MIETGIAHAAVEARDKRFDGLFFTGVTSTGIYCRCVCPARIPKRENRRFFPAAAAAEKAGFRPCLLCRPELAPGLAPIDSTARLAHDALKLIEAGALELRGLEDLARDLGITSRHLRRATFAAFGAAPVDLAQTHRLLTAKRLLADSGLSITEIAFASGFKSVRRFNAVFKDRYGMAPSDVRRRRARPRAASLQLHFAARGAFEAAAPARDLAVHAIAGMEAAHDEAWVRTLQFGAHRGWIALRFAADGVSAEISEGLFPAARQVAAAVRGAFDLDADIEAIAAALGAEFPGAAPVRLPGAFDAFEAAARTIIGQQITLAAARTIGARLVARFGAPIETPFDGVTHLFPSPARLAEASAGDIAALGMPAKRAECLRALAAAVADRRVRLARGAVAAGREGLARVPGVGAWTIEYAALRGLGDPDAFPLGDAGLRAAFSGDLARASAAWRPWRGYGAALLWRQNLQTRAA